MRPRTVYSLLKPESTPPSRDRSSISRRRESNWTAESTNSWLRTLIKTSHSLVWPTRWTGIPNPSLERHQISSQSKKKRRRKKPKWLRSLRWPVRNFRKSKTKPCSSSSSQVVNKPFSHSKLSSLTGRLMNYRRQTRTLSVSMTTRWNQFVRRSLTKLSLRLNASQARKNSGKASMSRKERHSKSLRTLWAAKTAN